jgi:hypothetical protein
MAIKKNEFYSVMFGRQNAIKNFIYGFFIAIASWPRLLLEVFVRKEFGERYFSFSTSCIIFIILAGYPYALAYAHSFGRVSVFDILWENLLWYMFLFSFMYCCFQRRKELNKRPKTYSKNYFSLSSGIANPKFDYNKIFGTQVKSYYIVTLIEPGIFFVIGVLLILIHQKTLGITLTICSIIYSISWRAQYAICHNKMLELFDIGICHDEMTSSLSGKSPDKTKGFNSYSRRDVDEDEAEKLFSDEDANDDEYGKVA